MPPATSRPSARLTTPDSRALRFVTTSCRSRGVTASRNSAGRSLMSTPRWSTALRRQCGATGPTVRISTGPRTCSSSNVQSSFTGTWFGRPSCDDAGSNAVTRPRGGKSGTAPSSVTIRPCRVTPRVIASVRFSTSVPAMVTWAVAEAWVGSKEPLPSELLARSS